MLTFDQIDQYAYEGKRLPEVVPAHQKVYYKLMAALYAMSGCGMDPKQCRLLKTEIRKCCIEMGEREQSELAIHKLEQERIKQTELLRTELSKCKGSDIDKLQIAYKIMDAMLGVHC